MLLTYLAPLTNKYITIITITTAAHIIIHDGLSLVKFEVDREAAAPLDGSAL